MFKAKKIDWYYSMLLLLAVALPFSEALISVAGVLLLLVSFGEIKSGRLTRKFHRGSNLLLFSSIYLIYALGFVFCTDTRWGLYDLQKNIPFLIIPLAFVFGRKLSSIQLKRILLVFTAAVILSALITLITFYSSSSVTVLDAQEFGFIHHIRFSFEIVFAMTILTVLLFTNEIGTNRFGRIGLVGAILFLFLFLIWHQSFTGLITFLGTTFLGGILLIVQMHRGLGKRLAWFSLVLVVLVPVSYLYYSVKKYYHVDQIDFSNLEAQTALGNTYVHDLNNRQIENGHYVGLYRCEPEMQQAWDGRARLKYTDTDVNGYQVKETLIRYLTSKNFRKDADGVNQLTNDDIRNIEAGVSNYILANKGLSLYPRIYVSLWGLDTYMKTGYANQQSLSQRIEYAKAALLIIKDHFWFGVGTGNWKQAYRHAYQEMESKMDPARYGDAHNQYLNYWVKFGLIGLIWILFVIVYPVVKTKAYLNPIFFLFLVSMLIANLGDSNLETHVGSNFFVFVYCLFVSSEKWRLSLNRNLVQ